MTLLEDTAQEKEQLIGVKDYAGSREVGGDVAVESEGPDSHRACQLGQKVGILNPRLASSRMIPSLIRLGP